MIYSNLLTILLSWLELTAKKTLIFAYYTVHLTLCITLELHFVYAYCCISGHSVEIPRTRGSSWVSRAFLAQKSLHRYALAFSFAYFPFSPCTVFPSGHLHLLIVELFAGACQLHYMCALCSSIGTWILGFLDFERQNYRESCCNRLPRLKNSTGA